MADSDACGYYRMHSSRKTYIPLTSTVLFSADVSKVVASAKKLSLRVGDVLCAMSESGRLTVCPERFVRNQFFKIGPEIRQEDPLNLSI